MTLGAAAGKILECFVQGTLLEAHTRREILKVIPPECRFVNGHGHIAALVTIQAILDWKGLSGGK